MPLKRQQTVSADLKRNVFRCRLNCSVFEIQRISADDSTDAEQQRRTPVHLGSVLSEG